MISYFPMQMSDISFKRASGPLAGARVPVGAGNFTSETREMDFRPGGADTQASNTFEKYFHFFGKLTFLCNLIYITFCNF